MNDMINNHRMPTLFISHSTPLLAIDSAKDPIYKRWASNLPRPKAILIFSAHWLSSELVFGETGSHEQLIYDFFGFPEALYQLQYPAPGSPWLMEKIQNLLGPLPATNRGLDHGVWVPLLRLWPEANIPILQMSLPNNMSNQQLYELGQSLSPLRQQEVLIIASGMVTHNLHEWNPQYQGDIVDWAKDFDDWTKQTLTQGNTEALLAWQTSAPSALRNHPTPEHFQPLLIAAGASNMENVSFPVEGFENGILSTRSVQFD